MLRSVAFAELARNLATRDCERMVESNIAVLRGKTIAEAKEEYDEQLSPVPYDSPILTESNWWSEPEVEEAFESCLYARRIVWSVATRREPAV